jgi:hypothetical protein
MYSLRVNINTQTFLIQSEPNYLSAQPVLRTSELNVKSQTYQTYLVCDYMVLKIQVGSDCSNNV